MDCAVALSSSISRTRIRPSQSATPGAPESNWDLAERRAYVTALSGTLARQSLKLR